MPDVKWCIFSLKSHDILNRTCLFNPSNAASSLCMAMSEEHKASPEAFMEFFAENVNGCERSLLKDYGTHKSDKYATDPQAEILCCENIPLNEIVTCTFSDVDTMNEYAPMLNGVGISCRVFGWSFSKGPYENYPNADRGTV